MMKIRWEESLTCAYSYNLLQRRKRSQNEMGLAVAVHGASSFSGDQSPSACFWHFPHEKRGFCLEIDSHWYGWYVHFPPGLFFTRDHGNDLDVETLKILLGLSLNLPSSNVKLSITPVISHRQRQL